MLFKNWLLSENDSKCSKHGHFVLKHPDCLGYLLAFSPLSAKQFFSQEQDVSKSCSVIIEYISKHNKVNREDLENLLDKHKIKEEACRFKLQVIADIWNQREEFFNKFKSFIENHEIESLINAFSQISPDIGNVSSIAPSKAGLTVELLMDIGTRDEFYGEDPYVNPDTWAERLPQQTFSISDHHRIMQALHKKGINVNELQENWLKFWENLTIFLTHP